AQPGGHRGGHVAMAGADIEHGGGGQEARDQLAPTGIAAEAAVDPPKFLEAAGDLNGGAGVLVQQLGLGGLAHHASAASTRAEFLDPKAMQLHSAWRMAARRPGCGM